MPDKILNTRIHLANDTLENWLKSERIIGKGEACVAFCPLAEEGQWEVKVKYGDGVKKFKELPWAGTDLGDIPLASVDVSGLLNKEDYKKLLSIENGAQANIIDEVSVNGETIDIEDKKIKLCIPEGRLAEKDTVLESDLETGLASKINLKADKAATLAGYGIADAYTKTEVDSRLSSVYRFKGAVDTYDELPDTEAMDSDVVVGDVYNILTADPQKGILAGDNVAWDGTRWDRLAGAVDLSGYATTSALNTELVKKVDKSEGFRLMSTLEAEKLGAIASGATKVKISEANGYINIDGEEKQVFKLPENILSSSDALVINGGNAGV